MNAFLAACLLLGTINLDGVTGGRLTARAAFDANNVRLGDPMILTVDFIGTADFAELHPPALSREVDRRVWKVDDVSAKTDTYRDARRLVYRVRPLREGVLEFPALEFSYNGGAACAATRPIPVHVKPGTQAALAGLDDAQGGLPQPDGILVRPSVALDDDELFRWRKACRTPTAAAFASFDFPEARLNEAACHILDGNWAKAIRIYSALEWRTGQTPAIERGLVAALARKHDSAAVELPMWRQVARPVLRHAWRGRIGLALGFFAAAFAVLWALGRLVRALACVALVAACALTAHAQAPASSPVHDLFEEMERMHEQMMNNMNTMMGGLTINGERQPPVALAVSVATSRRDVQVGETFDFIVSIELPKSHTLGQVRLTPSETFGLAVQGEVANLPDAAAANTSNVVKRLTVPVRYDVPFKGELTFRVDGMVSGRQQRGRASFTFSQSVSATSAPFALEVKPLPTDNQPADFSGIVGSGFRLRQSFDRNVVETNDVVVVTCTLDYRGYAPPDAVDDVLELSASRLVWRRYVVAAGDEKLPDATLTCYDTDTKTYRTLTAAGATLRYKAPGEEVAETVAVNGAGKAGGRELKLRFAPRADAAVVAVADADASPVATETSGDWVRLDDGRHAGWVMRGEWAGHGEGRD